MQKTLFSALFVIALPIGLLISDYGHHAVTSNMGWENQIIKADFTDSVPRKSKSVPAINSKSTKSYKTSLPTDNNADPKRIKGSIVDTAGIIYDLNAFYPLGR